MPRNISAELIAHLEGENITLAVCTRIERLDGEVLGFTSHDRNLSIDGLTYEAGSAVDSSVLRNATGTGVDNLEIMGLLDSLSITEGDIKAGLYDGAKVLIFFVNWADLTMGKLILLKGYIGQITYFEGHYVAEIRSLMQRLQQVVGELTSPTCRVKQLGDARCKIDLGPFTFAGKSVAASPAPTRRTFTLASTTDASGYFNYGTIEFTTGPNAVMGPKEIKRHTLVSGAALIELQEALPFNVASGHQATIIAGCDRRLSTCRDKFSNVVNFRGEPHLPGTDSYLRRGARA